MDQHIVEIPKIDVGQIVREDTLDLNIVFSPLTLVRLDPSLIDQRVEPRVYVEASVCPGRWNARRVKRIFEDIRIFVTSSDPAQRIHLKQALRDERVERRELEGANVQLNPNGSQLLLEHGDHQACIVD